jgi:hypothetical protein
VAEQRCQAVLAVIADGLTVSRVAEKVGVSWQMDVVGGFPLADGTRADSFSGMRRSRQLPEKPGDPVLGNPQARVSDGPGQRPPDQRRQ